MARPVFVTSRVDVLASLELRASLVRRAPAQTRTRNSDAAAIRIDEAKHDRFTARAGARPDLRDLDCRVRFGQGLRERPEQDERAATGAQVAHSAAARSLMKQDASIAAILPIRPARVFEERGRSRRTAERRISPLSRVACGVGSCLRQGEAQPRLPRPSPRVSQRASLDSRRGSGNASRGGRGDRVRLPRLERAW
jgi:hypothetical protein